MGRKSLPSTTAREMVAARKKHSGGRNGGRPRIPGERCPCAVMTLRRAQARGRSAEHAASCPFYQS